jgi:type VI secretion system protein VasI
LALFLILILAGGAFYLYQELEKAQSQATLAKAQLERLANPKLAEIAKERQKIAILLTEETEDLKKYAPLVPMSVLKTAIVAELRLADSLLTQEAAVISSGAPALIQASKTTPDPTLANNLEKELQKVTEEINRKSNAQSSGNAEAALALENELGTLNLLKAVLLRNYLTARYGLNTFMGAQPPRARPVTTSTGPPTEAADPSSPPPAAPTTESSPQPPAAPPRILTVADILGNSSEWRVQGPWATRLAGAGDGLSVKIFRLAAVNHAEINGIPQQASLFVSCQGNKTEMYVTFSVPLAVTANKVEVQYRLDNEEPVKEVWNASTDQTGVFSPKPIPLLRKMSQSSRIYISVGFENRQSIINTYFDLDQLSEALNPIQSACNWR